ncbi:M4 family metallopeptidase [Vitiosangium sp. GDMCC 1.1324]|uniref:M4 family metallopeptidase n=1 Tax=Vitiosangium sp. (strain GDMCC 1.1324) TaxID=2138576 RepID=UPI000D3D3459|nr:M4 family metallopeptidase [Vitiosangium sp. GDMCC 1.1324]PTL81537.1 peptidase M4 [Vitiosangium sp. GDMCC 1.1324]
MSRNESLQQRGVALANRVLRTFCVAWLGASLAACGSTAEVNEEAVRAGGKDVDVQAALARFKDVQVVGSEAGVPYAVTGRLGRLSAAGTVGELRAKDELREVVADIAPVFRVSGEDLVLKRSSVDAQGNRHARFQQTLNGLRVVGGELIVHADGAGNIYAVNGSARTGEQVSSSAKVAPEAALKAAVAHSTARGASAQGDAKLVYLRAEHSQELSLSYEVRVKGERDGMPADDLVYVDAQRGGILLVNPLIHSALNRKVYSANNSTTTPGTLKRSEGQAAVGDNHVDTNYTRLGQTYSCYQDLFGRDSIDNAGATLISTVHYGSNYVNAYWDSTQMVYGDGDGVNSTMLGLDLDVTVHELTHAVTEHESNLTYSGESGGLNESMSDIFAGVCESYFTGTWATTPDIFMIGEDIWTPATANDALRYMDDPAKDGVSLDYYPDYGGQDVHYSSGISNLVFAMLSKGGTHPRGKTTNTVPAIGPEKAGRIFYYANTNLFTASTTFEQAKTYMVQAAEALYGVGSAEATAVTEAWKCVGVPAPPPVTTPLTNGVAVSLSGSSGSKKYYTLEVPAGQSSLAFDMSGGSGDADLYVKFGAVPTSTSYDCRPYASGNAENCPFTNPAAGTWYVMVNGYSTYSGASLKGTYGGTSTGTPVSTTVSGSVASGANANYGAYSVVAGTQFKVVMTGSGDPDLYVRFGAAPTTTTYNCRPYTSGASETCDLTVPAGQSSAYVMVRGYTAATYTLNINYTKP